MRISAAGHLPTIPEICDYELRRELIRTAAPGLRRLDRLRVELTFLPITSEVMLKAAELWALARGGGKTISDPRSLGADAILGAQAVIAQGRAADDVVIATMNVRHLRLFADAREWTGIA